MVSLSGCTITKKEDAQGNVIDNNQDADKVIEDQSEENDTKENKITKKASEESIVKKVVVIDPGHSSKGNKEMEKQSPDSGVMKIKDPGGAQGISTKTPEYAVNMKVALKLKNMLEENNITVIMTKTKDTENPGNIERAEIGNINNANLSVRIHCDSSESQSVKGASMLIPAPIGYAKDISGISKKYGQIMLDNLVLTAGMNNKGVVERSDLTGFNWSKVPVVLIEMGFMSNQEEDQLLNNDNYQNKLARGLCKGILEALK
ncbi:N-acetylmuramoyl-L-alanine amidase [Clostridium beijerinckii]|uniref:N-acetylmuramoyl-L-alanine amidase n=2 Tax=Clostridium beijerinckii TaxID=1520 RepID=A0A7X9XRD6_CLOBE|nr:N-acetylmuramoyl-L-alanine amidase [Clostridium beijerinckii]